MDTIEQLIELMEYPHRDDCAVFIQRNRKLFDTSKGSACKHQAWPGGYRDHITEVMNIAGVTHIALSSIRPLPFSLSDALLGCFLHDIEKLWKHALDPADRIEVDKQKILDNEFHLEDQHYNAVKYAHGEGDDYHATLRVQTPLAAFVHHCDNTSARIWPNEPSPSGMSVLDRIYHAQVPISLMSFDASEEDEIRQLIKEEKIGVTGDWHVWPKDKPLPKEEDKPQDVQLDIIK